MAGGQMYPLKPSFAGGELTPALYGRTDLQKYDVGASRLENMIVLRYGGATRRPGFRYVAKTQGGRKARLIPFQYSTEQSYVLEFTAGCIRVFTQGGIVVKDDAPLVIPTSYTEADLSDIKYTQSADVLFLVHVNHPPMTLTRYGVTDWKFERMDIAGGPFEDPNTKDGLKIGASGVQGEIMLKASVDYFTEDMVGSLIRLGHTMGGQLKSGIPTTSLVVRCVPGGTVYVESFGFWNGSFIVEKHDKSTDKWIVLQEQHANRTQNYTLNYTNKSDDIVEYRVRSNEFDTSVWANENERQRGYVTIQTFAQDYYGVARITAVNSATSAAATVTREFADTEATNDFSLSAWSAKKGYPQAVSFFEDRLVFAGSRAKPQTYWASQSGDYYNFWVNTPQQDSDAITGTLSGGQMNGIRAIIPFGEMLMLTSGGEYKVGGGNEVFTPTNQKAEPQEYRGINNLTPVVIGGRIVYVQHQGSVIRDLTYSYDVDKYTGDDVSLLAAHLFEGQTIVALAYQQTPNTIVWCVREDGMLLGMTYIKEQDVYAWHKHTTSGKFADVCTISGNREEELWAVVERDGAHYVEQMGSQIRNTAPHEQFYVDSGYVYQGEAKDNLTGLVWLSGKDVAVLADGNVLQELRVDSDGVLKLPKKFSKIVVGLSYESVVQTMPIEFSAQDGSYMGRKKRVSRMTILFRDTRGGLYGVGENRLDAIKWRSTEKYDNPIELYSGKRRVVIPGASYEDTVYLTIKQTDPLPLTILSIVPEVEAGG